MKTRAVHLAILAACVLIILPMVSKADSVATYDFAGTLTGGGGTITGQFTLDVASPTSATVTTFNFTTPLVSIAPPIWTGQVDFIASSDNAGTPYDVLQFSDAECATGGVFCLLPSTGVYDDLFEFFLATDSSGIPQTGTQPTSIAVSGPPRISDAAASFGCEAVNYLVPPTTDCSPAGPYGATFTAISVTSTLSTVPEPSSLFLLGVGLLALVGMIFLEKRFV